MSNTITPKFPAVKNSLHSDLKKRVQAYFIENKINQTGGSRIVAKAIFLLIAFIGVYLHLLIAQPGTVIALLECALLGVLVAAIGFNIMHDGGHGSFSENRTINILASWSASMLGVSQFMWNMKHNMIHHTYTNVEGVDDDIEIGFLMKMAPTQPHHGIHKWQHIYFVPLYSLMYFFWTSFSDYKKYFTKKIGSFPLKKMSTKEHIQFWAVKIWHAAAFIALPIFIFGFWNWLIGYSVMALLGGFILSIVFQLAHTVEHTDFPVADVETNKLPDEFAAHQIKTTANFATGSKVISWFVGGLNFQVEHHLFPKISHIHYPAINKIVIQVCKEHELNYIEYPNLFSAVRAHVQFLKRMGKTPSLAA
jgi:linoleoyl-CoA desaturase